MAVTIEPLPYEELPVYVRTNQRAFQSGLGAILLEGGPEHTPEQAAKFLKFAQDAHRNPINRFFKAVDTTTGDTIGVARWQVFPQQQTEEQLNETLKKTLPGEAGYVASWVDPIDFLIDSKREYMGTQPYIYLSVLTVDPAHQGKGAGKVLIKWGTDQADELGIPTYVEASKEGFPVYQRCGFEQVRQVQYDMHKLGRTDIPSADINRVMIRPARVNGKVNKEIGEWRKGHAEVWEPKYA